MSIKRNDAGKRVIDFTAKGRRITRVIGTVDFETRVRWAFFEECSRGPRTVQFPLRACAGCGKEREPAEDRYLPDGWIGLFNPEAGEYVGAVCEKCVRPRPEEIPMTSNLVN
jgi:hypothetical protein